MRSALSFRAAAAGLLAAISTARPPAAPAQSVADYERQLDTLAAQLRVAELGRQALRDSVSRELSRLDSIDVGSARILAPHSLAPTVRWAMTRARDSIRNAFGDFDDILAGTHAGRPALVVRRDSSPERRDGGEGEYAVTRVRSKLPHIYLVGQVNQQGVEELRRSGEDSIALAQDIQALLLRTVMATGSPVIHHWMGIWAPTATVRGSFEWAARRLDLVGTPAAVARDCYAGDTARCLAGFGLVAVPDPVMTLYDAPTRRQAVMRLRSSAARFGNSAGVNACLRRSDDAQCVAVLRDMVLPGDPVFGYELRVSLVEEALAMGGPRAFERFFRTPGSIGQRLEAAAGRPLGEVVARWQHHVVSAQRATEDINPAIVGAALGWTVLFAALALRSTRWR